MNGNDDILKWNDDGEMCESCYNEHEGSDGDSCWNPDCSNKSYWEYANAAQIKEKIADAEAGNHAWVRGNTLFVCDGEACKKRSMSPCDRSFNHRFWGHPPAFCKDAKIKPFRGTRPEENATGEDCSSVEKEIRGATCTYAIVDEAEDINIDDFELLKYTEHGKYNKDRKFLKNAAAMIAKTAGDAFSNAFAEALEQEIKKDIESGAVDWTCLDSITDYGSLCPDKKEDNEDMGSEYVVLKDFKHFDLAITDMAPIVFKQISSEFQNLHFCKDEIIRFKGEEWDILNSELLRLGFIEEKVCDPVVLMGDKFKSDHGEIYSAMIMNKEFIQLNDINSGGTFDNTKRGQLHNSRLSNLVGKDRLKEFTPCKVEIKVVV